MKALHVTLPALVPKPIAWGTYRTDENVHFFLCTFCDMSNELCSLDTFPKMLAELHQEGVSPNGKFGFPVVTYQGRLAQDPTWYDTWEEAFSRNIDIYFEHELKAQGPDEEIAHLREIIMKRVIPRLLRPMETGGRSLTPRLIHGDLVRLISFLVYTFVYSFSSSTSRTCHISGLTCPSSGRAMQARKERPLCQRYMMHVAGMPIMNVSCTLVAFSAIKLTIIESRWRLGDLQGKRWASHTSRHT